MSCHMAAADLQSDESVLWNEGLFEDEETQKQLRPAKRVRAQRKKSREDNDSDWVADEDELEDNGDDYLPLPKRARCQAGGGSRRAAATQKATAAARKVEQQEAEATAHQRATEFKTAVGEQLSWGMSWAAQGQPLCFSCTVDPLAFNLVFDGIGETFKTMTQGTSKRSGRELHGLKLSAADCMAVFGKGQVVKEYKLMSKSDVQGMTVVWDEICHKASFTVTWGINSSA